MLLSPVSGRGARVCNLWLPDTTRPIAREDKHDENALAAYLLSGRLHDHRPIGRPILRRRLGRLVLEEVEGLPLVVLPQVFNPAVFRSSSLLARAVLDLQPPARDSRALDMGCGSGIGAVFAARKGYQVTAVDLNPAAVRCTGINARLNSVEEDVDVKQGDLYAPVEEQRFDLVLFNPPFFVGRPRDDLDSAWRGEGVLQRFTEGLPSALRAGGNALVVMSTDGETDVLLGGLAERGLRSEVALRREYATEILTVWQIEEGSAAEVSPERPPETTGTAVAAAAVRT